MVSHTSAKAKKGSWMFDRPEDLKAFGARFAAHLRRGDVVALIGPLGAGKTTFVQGVAAGLGYRRLAVSPTFALANEYGTKEGKVYHMDMYRLSERELQVFPLEDYWQDGISLVEWADRVRERWPEETLEVHLVPEGPRVRRISIKSPSPYWKKRLSLLFKNQSA